MGLVINEGEAESLCTDNESKQLLVSGKQVEIVPSYKYLNMYVVFTSESKETELNANHINSAIEFPSSILVHFHPFP